MAWVTPRTWSFLEDVTEIMMNTIRDNLLYLYNLFAWNDRTFSAGDYSAMFDSTNNGTWVVSGSDVALNEYVLQEKLIFWQLSINASIITDGPQGGPNMLLINAPVGLTFHSVSTKLRVAEAINVTDPIDCVLQVFSSTQVFIRKYDGTQFVAGDFVVSFQGFFRIL